MGPDPSATLMDLVVEVEREIGEDQASLNAMEDQLRRQSGQGTPNEQLERVREVRASVTSEDPTVRYAARSRVRQALSQLIRINCSSDGIATVIVANGLIAWQFDKQANLLGTVDIRDNLDLHNGLTTGVLADNAPRVDAVLRRSAA